MGEPREMARALVEASREGFRMARAVDGPHGCEALVANGKCSHCEAEARRYFPLPDRPPGAPSSARGETPLENAHVPPRTT